MQKFFININRSGGTIFAKTLGLHNEHATAKEFIANYGRDEWDEGYKFAFVRNPWDRAVALYKFRMNATRNEGETKKVDFKDWVRLVYEEQQPDYYDNPKIFMPQVDWLKNDKDIIDTDYVARFENMDEEYAKLATLFGFDNEPPELRVEARGDYRSFYDSDTVERIASWYREDVESFDYGFDGSH